MNDTDDDQATRENAIATLELLIEQIAAGNLNGLVMAAEGGEGGGMQFFTSYTARDTLAIASLVNHWAINRLFEVPMGSMN